MPNADVQLNPYESPSSDELPTPSIRRKIVTLITATLAFAFALASGYFIYKAERLKIDYPGLHDPSPEVDGYWPAISHLFFIGFAVLAGLAAAACAVAVVLLILAKRRDSNPKTNGTE